MMQMYDVKMEFPKYNTLIFKYLSGKYTLWHTFPLKCVKIYYVIWISHL